MNQTTLNTVGTLRGLFFHNDWARDQLMERAVSLTDEQLDRSFEMGLGSVRKTLRHLWGAERYWLRRWREEAIPPGDSDESLAMQTLWTSWRRTAVQRNEFLDRVGEAGQARRITFTAESGREYTLPLGDMMLHVCNHGTHHRAQVLSMMRQVGIEKPPGLDYIFLKLEDSLQPPVSCDRDVITGYYAYNDWAWRTIHGLAADLDDDHLDRPVEIGVGSLRKTLTHGYDAEHWWLRNWSGEPADTFEQISTEVSITRLGQLFDEIAAQRNDFIAGCSKEALIGEVRASPTSDRQYTFRLGDTMLQMCGHGTHHRSQVINLLRRFGVTAPEMDYIDWLAADH